MYLQLLTKFFTVLLCLLLPAGLVAQSAEKTPIVTSPYKHEYNPWYKLTEFQRGFEQDSLTPYLDKLEGTPHKTWSRTDSLDFARISLQTGKRDLSRYYFDHLDVNFDTEEHYWWDRMMIYILEKDYEGGIESIHSSNPGILQFSKIYFLDRMLLAYMAQEKDSKWHKTNSVFKWEADSTLFAEKKKGKRYHESVIKPLENLEFVLKQFIHHIHEEDPIIARSCFEMGIIFENHVSLSQAYIAYSLGRHYNKWDKEILNNIKRVKGRLLEKKYKIPVFRKYFPRIEQGRLDYEVLKQKIIFEKNDTIPKFAPQLMAPSEEPELPISPELIIIAGIFLLFILVLVFLKSKNNTTKK